VEKTNRKKRTIRGSSGKGRRPRSKLRRLDKGKRPGVPARGIQDAKGEKEIGSRILEWGNASGVGKRDFMKINGGGE